MFSVLIFRSRALRRNEDAPSVGKQLVIMLICIIKSGRLLKQAEENSAHSE